MTTTAPPNSSHTGRTAAMIIVGALIAAIIVWFAVGAVRAATRPDASGTWEIAERFDSVVVDGDLADLDIAYRDVDRAELTLRHGDSSARLELDHVVRGTTLHVSLRHVREIAMPSWPWPWHDLHSPRLELVLPASLERDVALAVATDLGDVHVAGDFGTVSARSDIGDIELSGSAASVDVRTTAGEIDVMRLSTDGDLTAQSQIGDVTLDLSSLPDRIDVETDAGEVTVRLPEGSYAVGTEASLGDVELAVPNDPSASRRYEFATGVGDIEITH